MYNEKTKILETFALMTGDFEKYNTIRDRNIGKISWLSMRPTL